MIKKLDELYPGEKGIILKITGNPILRQRLLELGIREGKEVIRKTDAPMGDPISVYIMGTNLSFRRQIAKHIFVETGDKNEEV